MTADVLDAVMPFITKINVSKYLEPLNLCMEANEINTPLRQAHFLAQIGHESGSLRYCEEIASGEQYEGRVDLGNIEPGDGKRFKGRGLIQITGRANYGAYGTARGRDFIAEPELLATDPNLAADCAGWYWACRGLNEIADVDDVYRITKKINGGLNGITDRVNRLNLAKIILEVAT